MSSLSRTTSRHKRRPLLKQADSVSRTFLAKSIFFVVGNGFNSGIDDFFIGGGEFWNYFFDDHSIFLVSTVSLWVFGY